MNHNDFDIETLLAPILPKHFFEQYWEHQPLLVQNRHSSYYSSLLSVRDVDAILAYSRPTSPELKVVRNQQELLPNSYTHPDGKLNLNQLYKAYDEGHTIIINGLSQFWGPIASFCRALQAYLSHSVIANFYLSPQNSKGLMAHFDTHDVFVLQIEGSKTWQLYSSPQKTPLLGSFQPVIPDQHLNPPSQVIQLNPGDLLYIPRGLVHQAETTDSFSLHVTVGIYPAQWFDLINSALTIASLKNIEFRKALPVGYLEKHELQQYMKQHLYDLVDGLIHNLEFEEAIALLQDRFIHQGQAVADGHFAQLNSLDAISLDSKIAKRDHVYCRLIRDGSSISIQFPGNTVKGPAYIEPALEFIINNDHFLVSALPDSLSDEAKITLMRRLVRGGLLKVASES